MNHTNYTVFATMPNGYTHRTARGEDFHSVESAAQWAVETQRLAVEMVMPVATYVIANDRGITQAHVDTEGVLIHDAPHQRGAE